MPDRLLIGLMSGTSVDAIDAAIVRIAGTGGRYRAKVLHHSETPWPAPLRRRLLAIMAPATAATQEICELNFLVARHFALAVDKAIVQSGIPRRRIAAIGSHGQTVCHLPPTRGRPIGSTLQLGDISVIATLTGLKTVGNFRPADMALGGQGAPLVPWTDAALLTHKKITRAIQNIGGIANVTYLPASGGGVIAFDTGPGNMLIDAVVSLGTRGRHLFDRNGQLAKRGKLDRALFERLRAHPYFERRPPKSTGREDFGARLARDLYTAARRRRIPLPDIVHTVTHLTAWSIVDTYLTFLPALPDEVILCGGGGDNPALVAMLRAQLAAITRDGPVPALRRIDDLGIPNKSKEAASFALLAAATLDGIPANLPGVTGASRATPLAVVALP